MTSVELSRLLIQSGALKFGSFQTKSGRQSPFFLNFGDICDGKSLDRLADLYAASIIAKLNSFPDVIFGPAYKGIPLAVAIAGALSRQSGTPVSFAFDRKEIKDHGEGGQIVGRQIAPHHRVVIVDDVLTSGISIRHSIDCVLRTGCKVIGIMVGVDRCELPADGKAGQTSAESIRSETGMEVISLATIDDVISDLNSDEHLKSAAGLTPEIIESVAEYRRKFARQKAST
ncbi:MAG: orotate phosphoribosyltransferase [Proteobacteria bacterium]|nr:orotate phosphoribosyltransferase [Pseudomonadota bacterium]